MANCVNCKCSSCLKRECMKRMCTKCNILSEDIVEKCPKYTSNEEVAADKQDSEKV